MQPPLMSSEREMLQINRVFDAAADRAILLAWRYGVVCDKVFLHSRFSAEEKYCGSLEFVRRVSPHIRIGWSGTATVFSRDFVYKMPLHSKGEELLRAEYRASKIASRAVPPSVATVYSPQLISVECIDGLRTPSIVSDSPTRLSDGVDLWSKFSAQEVASLAEAEQSVDIGLDVLKNEIGPQRLGVWEKLSLLSRDIVGPVGITHGDFTVKNLLRSEDAVTLIDLDRFKEQGFQLFDLAHLLVQGKAVSRRRPWPIVAAEYIRKPNSFQQENSLLLRDSIRGSRYFAQFDLPEFWVCYFLDRVGKEFSAMNKVLSRWRWIVASGVRGVGN